MKLIELSSAYAQVHLPAKVALVVTKKPDGMFNLMTLQWFMRTSIQPPMFAISIGNNRFSHSCIEENRYFNLVFPTVEMKPICSTAGSTTGSEVDKFELTQVDYIDGKFQKLPVLTQAKAVFECEVVSQFRSGDHTIYVGEVKYSWLNESGELLVFR